MAKNGYRGVSLKDEVHDELTAIGQELTEGIAVEMSPADVITHLIKEHKDRKPFPSDEQIAAHIKATRSKL